MLRRLFADALTSVTDGELAQRLQQAAKSSDPGLAVTELEAANAELRALLIDLHAHVETLDSSRAREVEAAIWRELAASTERRRLSIGAF